MRDIVAAFLVAVFLCVSPALANSATQSIQNESTSSCGTTVDDKLAAARKAVQSGDKAAQQTALACLIEAVSTLSAQRVDVVRNDGNHIIAVPPTSKRLVP